MYVIIWPRQAKKCHETYAKCADSKHPAHAQSIIWDFDLHLYILKYTMILAADREGPDQTAQMRRLIWAFAVGICPNIEMKSAAL